jgi:surface polysaccharide O-acyltransferase-like enzyme
MSIRNSRLDDFYKVKSSHPILFPYTLVGKFIISSSHKPGQISLTTCLLSSFSLLSCSSWTYIGQAVFSIIDVLSQLFVRPLKLELCSSWVFCQRSTKKWRLKWLPVLAEAFCVGSDKTLRACVAHHGAKR